MTITDLLLWYNVGYVGTFAVGLIFLTTSILGADAGDVSADHDLEHEVDHDSDHDAEHDIGKVDGHVSAAAEHDTMMQSLLSMLGVGRCPFSIIMMSFLFLFSFIGLSLNILLGSKLAAAPIIGFGTYCGALIFAFMTTGRLAGLIGKLMPAQETYIKKESALVGKIGKSVYTFTNDKGYVQVYDDSKTLKEVSAINMDPSLPIGAGDDVLIVDYNSDERIFIVKAAPGELTKA